MQNNIRSIFGSLLAAGLMFMGAPVLAQAVTNGQQVPALWGAQNADFFYSNPNSFYSCDYVRHLTRVTLQQLGARNIHVQCAGGLPYDSTNSVTASFSTLQPAPTGVKTSLVGTVASVMLTAHNSCDLHLQVYENVIKHFHVYSQQEDDTCWDSTGDFQAKVVDLK